MARPIKPIAVRRTSGSALIEVQASSGLWTSLDRLGMAAENNLWQAVREAGYRLPFPAGEFLWEFSGDRPTNDVAPRTNPVLDMLDDDDDDVITLPDPSDTDSDDDTDTDSDTDDEPRNDPQPEPQPRNSDDKQEDEMTLEEMVRKIASKVAGELDVDVVSAVVDVMEARLKDFQPTTGPTAPLRDVIRVIEMRRADRQPVKLDGLFHHNFDQLLANCADGAHSYLPGPPGTGKSHAAEQVAQTLGYQFASLSCGPTTPESRLWGGMDANGNFFEPPFVKLARHAQENPDNGSIFCLDEMDNGHPGILATLNTALANGWFTAPNGDVIRWGDNFLLVGAANTFGTGPTAEFAGRNKLDPATLDRFLTVPWATDLGVEDVLVRARINDDQLASAWLDVWRTLRQNVVDHGIKFFVTMRGAINGAKVIAGGRSIDQALMLVAGNKLPVDQWSKVNPL